MRNENRNATYKKLQDIAKSFLRYIFTQQYRPTSKNINKKSQIKNPNSIPKAARNRRTNAV